MSWDHPVFLICYLAVAFVFGLLANQWAAWRAYRDGYKAGREDEARHERSGA